jgi:hypothetical protein
METIQETIRKKAKESSFNLNFNGIAGSKKKCVAYPKEDFLFSILYGDS